MTWTTTFMVLWFNTPILWKDSLFYNCLNVLTRVMITFYCIILNISKSYIIWSRFQISKVEIIASFSIHDNNLPYFCLPKMFKSRFWWLPSISWITNLSNRRLAKDNECHSECLKRRKHRIFLHYLFWNPILIH